MIPPVPSAFNAETSSMRIVHVVDYLMPSMGYQEFLLPKWNARHGHEVHILTSDRYYPVLNYHETWRGFLGDRRCGAGIERVDGVTIHRLPCTWEWRDRPWLKGLARELVALSPDVVFCHGSASPSAFRLAAWARRTSTPLLVDNHMTYVVQNRTLGGRLFYWMLRMLTRMILLPGVCRFLGVADECCDFLERAQGVPKSMIDCLPLGVDAELFHFDRAARERLRAEHGIPANATVVLQTGRLSPEKGPHILAQAMAPIMKRASDVWLVFVGGGSEEDLRRIRAPLEEQEVSDRLKLVGFMPAFQLAGMYSLSDISVYPLKSSLSCLEAAACGRVVIMTDLPAGRWRAEQGVGTSYLAGDIDDLREKLESVLSSPGNMRTYGERAQASVLNSFSYDQIARSAEGFMRQAIAGCG